MTNTIKIDTSIPTLSVVSLSGGTNNLANEGDVVTLSFTGSEKLRNPLVKLTGETQELSGTQQTWSTNYSVKAKDDAGRSPYGMEELVLWLDASNIDGRLNYSLNDGDAIAEWKDLSGHENHAIGIDASRLPVFDVDGLNSENAILFTSDHLLISGGVDLSLIHISEPTRPGIISYAVFCL